MRYFGVDFGMRKIGLALGDDESKITAPYGVISFEKARQELPRLVVLEGIDGFVLGKPVHMKKVEQEIARVEFLDFLNTLKPVVEVDERFSTKESIAMQKEGNKAQEDAIAAQVILDAYFSEL